MKKALCTVFVVMIYSFVCATNCRAQCKTPEYYNATPSNGLDCMGGMEQYLSRSIMMVGLWSKATWETPTNNNPLFTPYINQLVEIKAEFIREAAAIWNDATSMNPANINTVGSFYYGASSLVPKINNAYDIAGLPKPIIEASIFEYISSDPQMGVDLVPLPAYVINDFLNDPAYTVDIVNWAYAYNHFDYSQPTPNGPIPYQIIWPQNFVFNEMHYPIPVNYVNCTINTPDISALLTQMWFYYLATQYIDMGYRALHFGVIEYYTHNDVCYSITDRLCKKIRDYAHSKNQTLLINADTDHDIYVGCDGYTLLLDFNNQPIRLDETRDNIHVAVHPSVDQSCSNASFSSDRYSYQDQVCDADYMTELNFYSHLSGLVQSHGGLAPSGCIYDKTPAVFSFDFGAHPGPFFVANHNGYQPWGFDETSWFNQLSPDCQDYFLRNIAFQIKNDAFYRGYLSMPGILGLFFNRDGSQIVPYGEEFNIFLPHQVEPALIDPVTLQPYNRAHIYNTVKSIWNINEELNFTITEKCEPDCNGGRCDGQSKLRTISGHKTYTCKITRPDVSSVYTWHVEDPGGNWLPFTFGPERILNDLSPGLYKITVRQDNLGFECPKDAQFQEKHWCVNDQTCCVYITRNDYQQKEQNSGGSNLRTSSSRILQETESNVKDIQAYPNPAQNMIKIKFRLGNPSAVTISISDILGKEISTVCTDRQFGTGVHEVSNAINNLSSGMYIINLISDGISRNVKFTKQ